MPIETKIDGDPDSIRSAARWLRDTLAESVHDCTSQVHLARTDSGADWTGPAADAFRDKLSSGGKKADHIADDAKSAADAFDSFADDLHTAQTRMARARKIATDGGLIVCATSLNRGTRLRSGLGTNESPPSARHTNPQRPRLRL